MGHIYKLYCPPSYKRTPVQWGNCNLKVTVAVNFIYTYFGLADPWKPHIHAQLWMEALRHTSQKKKKKKGGLNQQATGERSRFSNTEEKNKNLTEKGDFLQVLVWFWDTRRWSYWKVLLNRFSLLQACFNIKCLSSAFSSGPDRLGRLVSENAHVIL